MKLIVDLMFENGITGMRAAISDTAKWGDVTSGKRVVDQSTRDAMKSILTDIQSGKFAREWLEENKNGRPRYNQLLESEANSQVENVGKQLRSNMSWIRNNVQQRTAPEVKVDSKQKEGQTQTA
jgi:ketol-acid reductoisomerase